MVRLQILQLPSDDTAKPFVLVVDQCVPQRIALGPDAPFRDYWQDLAQQIGARGVIVTPETVDIPAIDAPLDAVPGRSRMARDADRLASRKAALLEALGMDHTRDWDDIRNAVAGLRKERDAQGAAIERVRQLHQSVDYRGAAICRECSAYSGQSTDNAPVDHDKCDTLRALTADSADEPTVKP
jgi:hypothetical protein